MSNENELSYEEHRDLPPSIIIYGNHGLGKTTFGSLAPNPVFIRTEDGLGSIKAKTFPKVESFDMLMNQLRELYKKNHDRKTVVIDSLDHLEPMVWEKVLEENPSAAKGKSATGIESYGYGKGYAMALDVWRQLLDALDVLRSEKNMTVILTAHAQIKRFENPQTEPYDRYEMKLHQKASALVQESADMVLFTSYYTGVRESKDSFGNTSVRAIGSGDRFLYTEERPAFQAKNRFSLPSEIPFDKDGAYWGVIAQKVPYFINMLAAASGKQE